MSKRPRPELGQLSSWIDSKLHYHALGRVRPVDWLRRTPRDSLHRPLGLSVVANYWLPPFGRAPSPSHPLSRKGVG